LTNYTQLALDTWICLLDMLGVWMVGRVGRPDLRIDSLVNLWTLIQFVWCVLYFHGIVITVPWNCVGQLKPYNYMYKTTLQH